MENNIKIQKYINECKSLGIGREIGKKVRKLLEKKLVENNEIVILDFTDVSMVTNSFVDELIGKKVKEMGLDEFKKSIKIINCNENVKEIVKFNILCRLHD